MTNIQYTQTINTRNGSEDITINAIVLEPANESGMLRIERIGESAERVGQFGWVRESTVTVVG